jgi:hypothetical protein
MTEEEKQKVVDLWEQGMTGKEIGEMFGVTRCAILGLINRMRNNGYEFKRPFERNRSIRENIIKAKKEKIFMVPKAPKKTKASKPQKKIKVVLEEEPIVEIVGNVDLMGLKPYSCRYPISADDVFPVMFCGKRQEHGSYCKEHGAICYYPSRN